MWGAVSDKNESLRLALEFTGDHALYGSFMQRVTREWPFSCENALTDYNINRKAWLGHAACALAHRLPESIVRHAWGLLTDEQRKLANAQAANAIAQWEFDYQKSLGLRRDVGEQVLLGWDT